SAVRGDTAAVHLDLHFRVRHIVPVDGGAGARQIGRHGKAQSVTDSLFARGITRGLHNAVDAFVKTAGCDAKPVDGASVGLHEVPPLQLDRIETEVACDLLEVELERKAWLRCAMSALGAARRLVGEDATA